MNKLLEILYVSTKLGLTSFGGPIAHIGYFHNEYVLKRKWLDEKSFLDLVSLCQFLPGPASSQVSYGIGVMRGGIAGGILAWLGFTLPSAFFLFLFAFFIHKFEILNSGWLHGLKLVAVAIVAQAVFSMGTKFSKEKTTSTITVLSATITLLWNSSFSQIIVIFLAGIIGLFLFSEQETAEYKENVILVNKKIAKLCLLSFFSFLIILPVLRSVYPNSLFSIIDSFYRAGSLVFGGGHVVLPLLEKEVVKSVSINRETFLAGYGAVQAVPGPLFTFASYIGVLINGWKGSVVATISIFLPSLLLVTGCLPFWNELRKLKKFQSALTGINASVVGILISAFYNPVWLNSIITSLDFCFALILYLLLQVWKLKPIIIVLLGAFVGYLIL